MFTASRLPLAVQAVVSEGEPPEILHVTAGEQIATSFVLEEAGPELSWACTGLSRVIVCCFFSCGVLAAYLSYRARVSGTLIGVCWLSFHARLASAPVLAELPRSAGAVPSLAELSRSAGSGGASALCCCRPG